MRAVIYAVIYARVSTDEQAGNYSLPTQLAACRAYAAEHSMVVAGEFSDDYTGTVPIERRPEGAKAYELLQSDSADALIVYRADRMGRPASEGDEWDIPPLIRSLSKLNKEIHTCNRGRIGTSFADLLLAMLDFKVAGDERRNIIERTSRGKAAKLAEGKLLGGWPPFGYHFDDAREALEIVEDEAVIVREIFALAARGDDCVADDGKGPLSMWQIAKRLTERRIPTHHDLAGRQRKVYEVGTWSPTEVSRLLGRSAYTGTYEYNFNGKVYRVQVPPIVPHETFDAAQAMREQNKRFSPRNATPGRYLVAGMIRCGCGCGRAFIGHMSRGRAWYVPIDRALMNYAETKRCTGKAVPALEVEVAAIDYIKTATQSEYFDACLVELARNSSAVDERRAELARITQEIERCGAEAVRLVDLVVDGDLVADALAVKSRALDARHAELVVQRDAIEAEVNRISLSDDDVQRYLQMRADVALGLEAATREQMRAILRVCGLSIVVTGGSVVISAAAFGFIPPSEPVPVRGNVRRRRPSHDQSLSG